MYLYVFIFFILLLFDICILNEPCKLNLLAGTVFTALCLSYNNYLAANVCVLVIGEPQ